MHCANRCLFSEVAFYPSALGITSIQTLGSCMPNSLYVMFISEFINQLQYGRKTVLCISEACLKACIPIRVVNRNGSFDNIGNKRRYQQILVVGSFMKTVNRRQTQLNRIIYT